MIIYEALKREFVNDVKDDIIFEKLYTKYQEKIGKTTLGEKRAWNNSLSQMRNVVDDASIPDDCGIAIEFNIPYTSKRVDFIVSGKNGEGRHSVVIIELKQWDSIEPVNDKDGIVRTFLHNGMRETTHPSYQAYTYAKMIEDYNQIVQDEAMQLSPCAYLHNYVKVKEDPIECNVYKFYVDKSPVFTSGEGRTLRSFISKHIKFGDNKESLYKIDNGRLRPSKSLQDCLTSMLQGNPEFLMIDDQKLVYEKALEMGRKSYRDEKKRVLIVEGGPGTGKSVLAINLLVAMTKRDAVCVYVTKNSAPRSVYAKKLKGNFKQAVITELFKGSGGFYDVKTNTFDVILCDEAHRLNKKSGMFKNLGENQIKEIINASKLSVFFIDENQRVHIDDAGSIAEIEKFAKEQDAEVVRMGLLSQFRCNGSDGFMAWIDDVLQIRDTANFDGFDNYDFQIFDDPAVMHDVIREKNLKNNKSRMLAGYCWTWPNESQLDPNNYDIVIGDYKASWNLNKPTMPFAIDPQSVEQIGCIHTSQGLEFDYVGVIVGDDIGITDDGKVYTDWTKRASTDASIKGLKSMARVNKHEADALGERIIKNTYRTLFTRGQKGCYVYCTNPKFAEYLKSRLKRSN